MTEPIYTHAYHFLQPKRPYNYSQQELTDKLEQHEPKSRINILSNDSRCVNRQERAKVKEA